MQHRLCRDWPITYEEMEPYYTKGEWELGIIAQYSASILPFLRAMSKPYPVPPLPFKACCVRAPSLA